MIKKIFTVGVVVMTIFWAVGLAAFVPTAQAATIASGDLIKASGAAVYYYAANGKRYVFPDQKTYKTWYADFSGVKTITDGELAAIQIGGNVTYKPGVKLIKITTDPKVYAVAANGTLRWISTEALAVALYGANWGTMVQDVPDPFFVNYTVGTQISAASDYSPSAATAAATSINVDKGLAAAGNQAAFNASLASDTPASATIPFGATGVSFLKFNLSGNGTLNEIVISRSGVGKAGDFSNVYLYDGSTRLTNGRSITSDSNQADFPNLNLTISGSKTLTVRADLADVNNAGDIDAFSVYSVNGTTVAGVMGNPMSVGSLEASTAVIAQTSASWSITLGTSAAEVAKFKIQNTGNSDLILNAITLRNGGSLSNSYLNNLKLMNSSLQLASAATMTGDKAVLVLSTPFTVPKSQTKNFTVIADVTGGRTNDNVEFYVDQNSDVSSVDATYGYGPMITNNWASGAQIVTMTGGQLTLGNNGPVAQNLAVNTTGQKFLNFSVSAQRNVTVQKIKITAAINTGGVLDAQGSGDWALLKNIKIVDLDSGTTLVGPLATANDASATWSAGNGWYKVYTDTFDVAAGATRHLSVQADLDQNMPAARTVVFSINMSGANYVYDNDSGQYVDPTLVVPNTMAGNPMTVSAATLSVTKSSIPTNSANIKGQSGVPVLGLNLSAGTADSLQLNRLTARLYGDDDGVFDDVNAGEGEVAANTLVGAAYLYDGSTLVKGPVNLSLVGTIGAGAGYYKADFNSLTYPIAAGANKSLTIKVDLLNTFTGTKYLAADLIPNVDMEVQDSQGNLLTTLSGLNLNLASNPTPTLTLGPSGTFSGQVDSATPLSNLIALGASNVPLAKYKFSANTEGFTITGAKLILETAGNEKNIANQGIILSYPNASGTTVTTTGSLSTSGGVSSVTFADGQLSMYVPSNGTAIMTISANFNTTDAGAINGADIRVGLAKQAGQWTNTLNNLTDAFVILGSSSQSKLYGNTDGIQMNNSGLNQSFTYKSYPTVGFASDTPAGTLVPGAATLIGKINITAGSNADVVFNQGNNNGACAAGEGCLTMHLSETSAGLGGLGASTGYVTDGSNTVGTFATAGTPGGEDVVLDFGSKAVTVPAGGTTTLYVYYDTATAGLTTTGNTAQLSLSDGADGNIQWQIFGYAGTDQTKATIIFRPTKYGGALVKP